MFVRLIAGILALLGFSAAIIAGLCVGNPFETILSRAWLTLVMFFILGAIVGAIVQAIIDEHRLQKMMQEQAEYAENAENVMQRENANVDNGSNQSEALTN